MTRALFCLLAVISAVAFVTPTVHAQQKLKPEEEKTVRLVWFPRFSPDSKWLIAAHGSWDAKEAGEVRLWDVEDGTIKHTLPHPRGVRSVAWSPKGKFFVTGSYGGLVRFYDPETGEMQAEIKLGGSVEGVRITDDDKRLITTHGNGDIRVFELPSRKEQYRFPAAHQGGIWGMAVSPSGKLLATAGKDAFVRIHDLESMKLLHQKKHPGETNGLVFTADNQRLLTGCTDSIIRVFEVTSGDELAQLKGHDRGSITDMQFSKDGKLLATAGIDGTVRIWDAADLSKASVKETLEGHNNLVFGVAISPDDRWLASAGWDDQVIVRDFKTLKEHWSWKR